MPEMKQYAIIRVRQMLRPSELYDGWGWNQRPPRIGDTGTIVEILRAPGQPDRYVVENSDVNGVTIWLGVFSPEELEVEG